MKSSGIPLNKLPPRVQAMVLAQQAKENAPSEPMLETERRLRQSQKPILNKLETLFLEKLKRDYPNEPIFSQAMRFELSRGHWYKPDFFLPTALKTLMNNNRSASPIAYEVKGPHSFRGGFENLKDAARIHPWCKFYLVWEDKEMRWQRQEILP